MISLQVGYAGMNIITKVSLNKGMSHYVLVVYRHVFATAAIAPFALIFERFEKHWIYIDIATEINSYNNKKKLIYADFYYVLNISGEDNQR